MSDTLIYNYPLHKIHLAAQRLWAFGQDTNIWIFEAPMGAGKTTLIKALCNELKCEVDTGSPTFSIVNEYYSNVLQSEIYHFDFYRLKNEVEVLDIGADEYFYSQKYCFIEWVEVAANIIPPQYLKINIKIISESTREISCTRHD
ncbi:MAG: tRNA (adenosine(37)-N6)-threonylcarbamoyltransferase complex ATPase subunit type 1 TsaE [Cytophagales bacterium]|nr:tRNA (adenosine(37)-N6)-threonylcarbamoyltransferase complex ATPase subunit type 1 TsaE [Cytophagales bacterium]